MSYRYSIINLSVLLCIIASNSAFSQAGAPTGNSTIEELIVFGRNTDLHGTALAASQGSVGGADLLVRPMLKVGELLESTPGMVVVQHSGSGKANQYFLRGFNLDHGTDYTTYVDGIPLNLRSHGHGQGYLDLNGLMPETVERVDYRKGPYYADLGDFSLAGASFINTIDRLDEDFFSTEVGQYGWRRLAGGFSRDARNGTLTIMGETRGYDGPWENAEELFHRYLWGKYSQNTAFGQLKLTSSAYRSNWHPTEQIPERAIGTTACEDEFCTLDDSAGGETWRWISTAQLTGDNWDVSLYVQHYDWQMESNPTYDFQLNQYDKRWTTGGQGALTVLQTDFLEMDVGIEFRYDDITDVGLDHHEKGLFIQNISDNEIQEFSLGTYVTANWRLTDRMRLMTGLRGDHFDFDVAANNASSFAGTSSDSQFSPKLGLAYAVTEAVELYGNWGKGFHSNDGRGVVNRLDPVPDISEGTGYEAGLRTSVGDIKITASYWWLEQDSELIFVGDSNSVEPKGGSEREGLELTAFWQARPWLGIDAVYTNSDARYVNNPEGHYVEGAVEESAQLGIAAVRGNLELSLRARYLGPYAMTADNSRRANGLTTLSWRGAWHWSSVTAYAEFINLMDTDSKDISYYYGAWVAGLDSAGVSADDIDCEVTNCRMSRATEPRTFRMGLSFKF